MTAEDAKAYLAENDIPQLMESLITGLMYHRPSDPLMFLEECLTKAKDMGLDKIKWNSFLEERKTTEGKESDNEKEGGQEENTDNNIEDKENTEDNEEDKEKEEEKDDENKENDQNEADNKEKDEEENDQNEKIEEENTDEKTDSEKQEEDTEKGEEEESSEQNEKEEAEKKEAENTADEIADDSVDTEESELPEKTHPQIIVLMGPPGSGKNIQLQKLGDKYEDFVCLTVGNLLRSKCEQNRGDDKWDAVNDNMNKGDFVDQVTVRRLLMHEMESKVSNYYIIDGIPRSVQQADEMGRFIGRINIVFLLDCSEEYCRQQLLRNREIQSRGDDENEAIEQRLLLFKEVTLPMLKRYDDMGLLHYINGEKDEDEVFDEICKIIDTTLPAEKEANDDNSDNTDKASNEAEEKDASS